MRGGVGRGRDAGQVTTAEEFVEFAEAISPRLRRTAFLLCGDWHTAEDLVQTALTKVFVSWRKIRRQGAVGDSDYPLSNHGGHRPHAARTHCRRDGLFHDREWV
jgi:hypothetical protein